MHCKLKACAQRFRYALFAFIHTQTYFEYYTLTLRLASLVKKPVIYAYWTKELFDICRENVSHNMATLPSVARHVIHADNLLDARFAARLQKRLEKKLHDRKICWLHLCKLETCTYISLAAIYGLTAITKMLVAG